MRIADRIALMRAGRIVQAGQAEELYRGPADLFAARFFCDFNEIGGRVRSGRGRDAGRGVRRAGLAEGARRSSASGRRAFRLQRRRASACRRGCCRAASWARSICQIAVQGARAPAPGAAARQAAREGEEVGIDIEPDEVLVFAAPDA